MSNFFLVAYRDPEAHIVQICSVTLPTHLGVVKEGVIIGNQEQGRERRVVEMGLGGALVNNLVCS